MRIDVFIGHALILGFLLWFMPQYAYVRLLSFIDVVAFFFVFIVPMYLVMAVHGFKAASGVPRLLKVWYQKCAPPGFEPECFREGAYLSQTIQRLTWGCAWVYTLFQSYELLTSMSSGDWSVYSLAPAVGLCVLPLLYASVIVFFLWVPLERFSEVSYAFGRDQDMALVRLVTKPTAHRPPSSLKHRVGSFSIIFIAGAALGGSVAKFMKWQDTRSPLLNAESSDQGMGEPKTRLTAEDTGIPTP